MKKEIIGILLSTLLIATTATTTLGYTTTFNEMNDLKENAIKEIEIQEENKITILKLTEEGNIVPASDPWILCMEACLAIGGLAGNCLWVIIGCTVAPHPLNPCCLAIPVLCGIDLGLFFGCLARCAGLSNPPQSQQATPCTPPHVLKLMRIINNPDNPQQPLLFIGILCLLRRLDDIEDWLVTHGYDVPEDFSPLSIVKNMQNQNININTGDCGC